MVLPEPKNPLIRVTGIGVCAPAPAVMVLSLDGSRYRLESGMLKIRAAEVKQERSSRWYRESIDWLSREGLFLESKFARREVKMNDYIKVESIDRISKR